MELQLEHNADIKTTIDLAWGVQHNKHKKKEAQDIPPDPTDPKSKQNLQLVPIGQDMQRKRYWVVDGKCPFLFEIPEFLYLRVFAWPDESDQFDFQHALFDHFNLMSSN